MREASKTYLTLNSKSPQLTVPALPQVSLQVVHRTHGGEAFQTHMQARCFALDMGAIQVLWPVLVRLSPQTTLRQAVLAKKTARRRRRQQRSRGAAC